VPDPKQPSGSGMPPGDACNGSDLAVLNDLGGVTLSDLAGDDLSVSSTVDLARHLPEGGVDAGGGSKCAGLPLLFCDGFEGGSLAAPWTTDRVRSPEDGGPLPTVLVESGRSYRGSHAVHSHVDQLGGQTYVQALFRQNNVGPMGHLYVRAFFYLDPGLAGTSSLFWAVTQDQAPYGGIGMAFEPNKHLDWYTYYAPINRGGISNTLMPYGRWVCMEWEVDDGPIPTTDAGTGTMHVWMDDAEISDLALQQVWTKPFFHGYTFGFDFNSNGTTGPLDIWVDEVAIDGARIGCVQ
jgi:hypothetical protein